MSHNSLGNCESILSLCFFPTKMGDIFDPQDSILGSYFGMQIKADCFEYSCPLAVHRGLGSRPLWVPKLQACI